MTNQSDVPPEDNSNDGEIESPVEGPKPDWMRAATASSESSFDENQAPDWLKAIRAGKSSTETESADNLADSSLFVAEEEEPLDDGMSDLERLLAEEGIDLSTVGERRPEGAQGMTAKDWLISTSEDDLVRRRLDDSPMESLSPPPPPEPATPFTASAASDSDDPLSDIERLLAEEGIDLKNVAEDRPDEAEGMSAKDWLISTSSDDLVKKRLDDSLMEPLPTAEPVSPAPPPTASYEDDKMVVSDDLPDWLQDMESDDSPAAPEPTATTPDEDSDDIAVASDDLPDWLQDIDEDESEISAAANEDDKMVVSDDLPDWLQESEDDEPEPLIAAPASVDTASDNLPDWLQDIEGDDIPPVIETTVAAPREDSDDKMVVSDDLPDWLQDIDEDEPDIPTISPPTTPSPVDIPAEAKEDDTIIALENLPDWLQEVDDEPEPNSVTPADADTASNDLPDWLREVERESTQDDIVAADIAPPPSDSLIDDDDLPDWLRHTQEDESGDVTFLVDEDSQSEIPAWLRRVQAEQEQIVIDAPTPLPDEPVVDMPDDSTAPAEDETTDEIPGWIQEAQAEEDNRVTIDLPKDTDPSANQVPVEDDDLPDWLQEVDLEEDEDLFEPSEPSPDPFDDILIVDGDDNIVEEELPDWLQEVQKEAQDEMTAEPALPVPAASTSDDQKDLPDWLQDDEDESDVQPAIPAGPFFPREDEEETKLSTSPPKLADEDIEPEPPAEPKETEPVPTTPPETPVARPTPTVEDNGSSGGMPDWLRKLREGRVEAVSTTPTPITPPVMPSQPTVVVPYLTAMPPPPSSPIAAMPSISPPPPTPTYDDLPDDPDERLKMAQAARDDGNINEAVRIYNSLVASGSHLGQVIDHTEQAIKVHPRSAPLYQVMGDAMMRDGRFQSALEAYRIALSNLQL